MKKHDEGYILAYVSVALILLSIIATAILTGALRNLNSQQNTIAQMEDQYAAEGMIEKVVAQLESIKNVSNGTVTISEYSDTVVIDGVEIKRELTITPLENGFKLTARHGTVVIKCEIEIAAYINEDNEESYTVTNVTSSAKYSTYEIGGATE